MKYSLIDTHCDTAYELFVRGESLDTNTCHISLARAQEYKNYAQFFAVWSDKRLDDENAWQNFLKISDHLSSELDRLGDRAVAVGTAPELDLAWNSDKTAVFLAIEDARLLCREIARLDIIKARGVKYLTLLWSGVTCIGGSHDTNAGLTDFGKEVVRGCFERGIIPDVSHASEKATDDVISIAYEYGNPIIASHSNSYETYPHSRNLRDRHLKEICKLGGNVGISLCPYHLADPSKKSVGVDDILRHIEHYLDVGGEDFLGFGCDLDGTSLPSGFSGLDSLGVIAEELARRNYSEELIEKIFWKNHYSFIKKYI